MNFLYYFFFAYKNSFTILLFCLESDFTVRVHFPFIKIILMKGKEEDIFVKWKS